MAKTPDTKAPTRVNAPDELSYLIHRIPKPIWDRAKAKAAAARPPLSMRWVLISLIERWAGPAPAEETPVQAESKPARKTRKAKTAPAVTAKAEPETKTAPSPAIAPSTAIPDLGDSF